MIQGIHHVSMKCSNAEEYAAVRAFYTELLRIPVLTEWEMGILLDTGAGIVEIFQDETAEKLGQGVIRHFAFAVKDVEACVAAVRAGGAEPLPACSRYREGTGGGHGVHGRWSDAHGGTGRYGWLSAGGDPRLRRCDPPS